MGVLLGGNFRASLAKMRGDLLQFSTFKLLFIIVIILFNSRTEDKQSGLDLAIKRHLPVVVDVLCQKGANMNALNRDNNCPLWEALETGQEDVASVLVGVCVSYSKRHNFCDGRTLSLVTLVNLMLSGRKLNLS